MDKNSPALWSSHLPRPAADGHKYARGHCLVIGGERLTGAARLAAEAAARIGAGLVTLIAPAYTAAIYRAACPAHIMIEDQADHLADHFVDARRNVTVIGPGLGAGHDAVAEWLTARQAQRLVLDADALNALAVRPHAMTLLKAGDVLTPHTGEYKKLFGDMDVQEAARRSGCVVVLKGAASIITDGTRVVVSDHATPYLATAGTGDVLAGMIAGLMAQGMNAFEAACAAVWMHGEAGITFGPGLVASDLPDLIPLILKGLLHA